MKTHIKQFIFAFVAVIAGLFTIGCDEQIKNIPSGYVGKLLTPTGWDSKILEAGQVDIGQTDSAGRGNTLVLLEATSATMKEQFMATDSNGDKQDHRVMLKKGTPVAVDIYVQVAVPTDPKLRNAVFALVTPKGVANETRVQAIYLGDVYGRFAQMSIRGKTREIFAKYDDYADVMRNYAKVNAEVATMVAKVFEENKVPLELVSGQISNVKPDETVWAANNKMAAADAEVSAIEKVGKAMRENPGYLQFKKWETIEKVAGRNNLTIIVGGKEDVNYTVPIGK